MISRKFRNTILAILFFVLLVSTASCTSKSEEEKKINIIFRYDDYSSRSHTDVEMRIIDIFREYDASITFGVIPFVCAGSSLDPSHQDTVQLPSDKAKILRTEYENGILDIALHGYSHQTTNSEYPSEFSGVDYQKQVESLTNGKLFLENAINAPVTTFIPPWNSYGPKTLTILEELNFSVLSADMGGLGDKDSNLFFVPSTTDLHHIEDAVYIARNSSDAQPVIVILFHSYDFKEASKDRGKITFQELSDQLEWLKVAKRYPTTFS